MSVIAASSMFPNPFEVMGKVGRALLGPVTGPLADAAANQLGKAMEWLVAAIIGAMVDLSVAVLGFFWDAAEPDPSASWFSGGRSTPYGQMVVLAMPLFLAFFLVGVIQGALKGDVAGMLRMALLRMPGAILAMSVTVAVTDLLLTATNEMSEAVLSGFRDDVERSTQMLGQVTLGSGLGAPGHVLFALFGMVGVAAATVLLLEMFVRGALIYIVLALCPVIYAASVWEALRGSVRKLGELALALILSKLAIAVALALSAVAMTASWDDSRAPTALATPEQAGAVAGAPLSEILGILVSAIVMFGVAAFMPFVLYRLLPLAEGALVAQGIKSGPVRAAQQALYLSTMFRRYNPASARVRGGGGTGPGEPPMVHGPPTPRPGPGPGQRKGLPAGGGGGGGAIGPGVGGGSVAVAPLAAAVKAASAVKKGAQRAGASADRITATYDRPGTRPAGGREVGGQAAVGSGQPRSLPAAKERPGRPPAKGPGR